MEPSFSVSEFIAVFNQTLEFAYPNVSITGELANFRISKNKWVYFDLKDEYSSVKFFGTIYSLPGPIEDGMVIQVTGIPRLHNLYGFSVTANTITPVGEGSIKKASQLLEAKLKAEGLFDNSRKRQLSYPPNKIGLIASGESAGFVDFIKILNQRWSGLEIIHVDVLVQGDQAPGQIIKAIEKLNTMPEIDVLVITRGGGSSDDLVAFNNEHLVRAIASSRIPTLIAIGHEIDLSLSEMAADQKASTPSNAAELLVPERKAYIDLLKSDLLNYRHKLDGLIIKHVNENKSSIDLLNYKFEKSITQRLNQIQKDRMTLHAYDPRRILKRGYALIKNNNKTVRNIKSVKIGDSLELRLLDGIINSKVINVSETENG